MLSGLANHVSGEWWSYLLIFGLAYLDVLFPLVPSETAVITAGVLSSTGNTHLSLAILAAATGAIAGDNTAYSSASGSRSLCAGASSRARSRRSGSPGRNGRSRSGAAC